MRSRNQVTKWTKISFQGGAGFFHDLRVQADPGKLHKIFSIGAGKIDQPRIVAFYNVPAEIEIVGGNPKLHRENVHSTDGKETERSLCPGEAVDDFVNGSIAAGGDDALKAFSHRMTRQNFGFSRNHAAGFFRECQQLFGNGEGCSAIGIAYGSSSATSARPSSLFFATRAKNI